jgi:hypothetical protein
MKPCNLLLQINLIGKWQGWDHNLVESHACMSSLEAALFADALRPQ